MGTADAPDQTSTAEAQQGPEAAGSETREYLAKLRSTPAEHLVTEVLFTLLNTAQVKIGRRDARLFIDLGALVHEHARRYVSGDLAKQVDQALGQLRLAQVQAESRAAAEAPAEPNDLSEIPTAPSVTTAGAGAAAGGGPAAGSGANAAAGPSPAAPPAGQPSPASRLWIPGRDF